MPELPDLVYVCDRLNESLSGDRITSVAVKEPILVRNLAAATPAFAGMSFERILPGRRIEKVLRHGPFVVFELADSLRLIVHPMLTGAFVLGNKPPGLITLVCEGGVLGYRDEKKMGKVYLASPEQESEIPRFASQGLNILSPEFTEEAFLKLIGSSRRQARAFLMEQESLSALGNAYSDEVLFEAGIHPKTMCPSLSEEQRVRLFIAIGTVIGSSIQIIRAAAPPLHQKLRDHMKVRNRKGEPCPRCGAKIRRESVLGYDTFFCPACQPASRKLFIDWNAKG